MSKGISRKVEGCFKGIQREFRVSLKVVSRVFHGRFKVVSRNFLGCFKKVLSVVQGNLSNLNKKVNRTKIIQENSQTRISLNCKK